MLTPTAWLVSCALLALPTAPTQLHPRPPHAPAYHPIHATAAGGTTTSAAARRWKPKAGLRWQIQYEGTLNTKVATDVVFLDGDDTSARDIARFKARGVKPVCYFNGGAWENWRRDKRRFPAALLGKPMDDWPGERWLDIRRTDLLEPIMVSRLKTCRAKGFVGAYPDNMNGWTENTGFRLTADDQAAYFGMISSHARRMGMAVGLLNNVEQIRRLEPRADFAINEECLQYDECDLYAPFVAKRKPVFHVEYRGTMSSLCAASPTGFSSIRKRLSLDAWVRRCPIR